MKKIREETIQEVMRTLGARDFNRSGDHVMTNCVYAPYTEDHKSDFDYNPSAGILITNGVSPYHCFSCGKKKGVLDVVREVGRYAIKEGRLTEDEYSNLISLVLLDEQEIMEIQEKLDKAENPVDEHILESLNQYHKYFENNGIDEELAKEYQLGFNEIENRVLFPIIDHKGKIPLVQGRTLRVGSKTPKYKIFPKGSLKSLYLYGENLIKEDTQYLIVVEGNKDVIQGNKAIKELNLYPMIVVVGLNGSSVSMPQANKLISWGGEIVLALDNDSAGILGEQEFYQKYWRRKPISYIEYPEGISDMDELVQKEGSQALMKIISEKRMYFEKQLEKIKQRTERRM